MEQPTGHQTLTQNNSTASFLVGFDRDTLKPVVPGTLRPDGGPFIPGFFTVDMVTPTSGISTFWGWGDWQSDAWLGAPNPSGTRVGACADPIPLCFTDTTSTAIIYDRFQMGSLGFWTIDTASTIAVPELAILPRLPRILKFGPRVRDRSPAPVSDRLDGRSPARGAPRRRDAPDEAGPRGGRRGVLGDADGGAAAVGGGVDYGGSLAQVRVAQSTSSNAGFSPVRRKAAALQITRPTPQRATTILALFAAAILLALEANALRVAGIALGLEQWGAMSLTVKEWIGMGTTGLALGQLVGVARLARQHWR